jgi:hypothetical protein
LARTARRRPDLLAAAGGLTDADRRLLAAWGLDADVDGDAGDAPGDARTGDAP